MFKTNYNAYSTNVNGEIDTNQIFEINDGEFIVNGTIDNDVLTKINKTRSKIINTAQLDDPVILEKIIKEISLLSDLPCSLCENQECNCVNSSSDEDSDDNVSSHQCKSCGNSDCDCDCDCVNSSSDEDSDDNLSTHKCKSCGNSDCDCDCDCVNSSSDEDSDDNLSSHQCKSCGNSDCNCNKIYWDNNLWNMKNTSLEEADFNLKPIVLYESLNTIDKNKLKEYIFSKRKDLNKEVNEINSKGLFKLDNIYDTSSEADIDSSQNSDDEDSDESEADNSDSSQNSDDEDSDESEDGNSIESDEGDESGDKNIIDSLFGGNKNKRNIINLLFNKNETLQPKEVNSREILTNIIKRLSEKTH